MTRNCDLCQTPYEAQTKKSRFCSSKCRIRAHRSGLVVPLAKPQEQKSTVETGFSAFEATKRVLDDAGRADSPAGVNAMLLAGKLDAGGDTGSAMAALSKQHLAALEEALKGAKVAASPLDELRERREARLRGA